MLQIVVQEKIQKIDQVLKCFYIIKVLIIDRFDQEFVPGLFQASVRLQSFIIQIKYFQENSIKKKTLIKKTNLQKVIIFNFNYLLKNNPIITKNYCQEKKYQNFRFQNQNTKVSIKIEVKGKTQCQVTNHKIKQKQKIRTQKNQKKMINLFNDLLNQGQRFNQINLAIPHRKWQPHFIGFHQSFKTLQKESNVSFNITLNPQEFIHNFKIGKWDQVIKQTRKMEVPSIKAIQLYEQIIQEMIEQNEIEGAKYLLQKCVATRENKQNYGQRIYRLQYLIQKGKEDKELFRGETKQERRQYLAKSFYNQLQMPSKQRLLQLLGQSIKYQQMVGELMPGLKIDIFLNQKQMYDKDKDIIIKNLQKTVKYPQSTIIEKNIFSKSGKYLAISTSQGIIQLYNPLTLCLDQDLLYQKQNIFMFHKKPVIALDFNETDQILISGDKGSLIKLWKIQNGKCIKKIRIEQISINVLMFCKDPTTILTAYDFIQIIGLKSGKPIKFFKGHDSVINDVIMFKQKYLVSCSKDNTVKVWNQITSQLIYTYNVIVNSCQKEPIGLKTVGQNNKLLILIRSNQIKLCNIEFTNIETIQTKQKVIYLQKNQQFLSVETSAKKKYIYTLSMIQGKMYLYSFNVKQKKLQSYLLLESNCEDLTHHPFKNILVMHENNSLYFYKP